MNETLKLFLQCATTGHISPKGSGQTKIQAQIFNEMLAIDRPRALTTMKAWAEYLQLTSSRNRHTRFQTLDEYIPYRVWDVGQMYVLTTLGSVSVNMSGQIADTAKG
jgi:hypothetical protein